METDHTKKLRRLIAGGGGGVFKANCLRGSWAEIKSLSDVMVENACVFTKQVKSA